ncbi:hypothetical protein F2P81_007101 [Scophthalmus maximus]|uniref:Telomere repeats-binding bouquet formation protein 1 n=1 Tax=Scophthalmus maximus TaxID=52904 RepID=A0A6A4T582_SCOMX|nr:hypothetical protein F2P81_007101 [Scophthalmus maximus]
MDKTGASSCSRNAIRTDLRLLLECLKFQMKCPDLQKQALLTIHSICEKRGDNVDLLRELGGVAFVYNLSKSSVVHSDVKETALFTLGTLAEANEEGQRVCVAAFPIIKIWLKQIALERTEIFQSVCSFIAMTVANNSALASGLAQYGIVANLFSLLASPNLLPEDRLSVLLTLSHCTEASAMSLVPGLIARHGEDENTEPLTNMESFRSTAWELLCRINQLERKQAKNAEDEQEDKDPPTATKGTVLLHPALPLPLQHKGNIKTIPTAYRQTSTHKHVEAGGDNNVKRPTARNVLIKENASELKTMSSTLSSQEEKAKTSGRDEWCSVCKGATTKLSSHAFSLEGGRERHTADSQLFKPPAPVKHGAPKETKCTDEELQDWDMSDEGEIAAEEHALSHSRCAGCVLPFDKVTSRTFASLQSSCHHSCDMHKALQEATDRFRTRHCSLLLKRENRNVTVGPTEQNSEESVSAAGPQRSREHCKVKEVSLTPMRKGAGKIKSYLPQHHWKKHTGITLTPLHRGAKKETVTSYNKTESTKRQEINKEMGDSSGTFVY